MKLTLKERQERISEGLRLYWKRRKEQAAMKKTKTKRISVYLITIKDSPAIGMSRARFFYKTTEDKRHWLADVDEDCMRDPATFKISREPSGMGFPDIQKMRDWMKQHGAKCVGFIKSGKLYVTRRIRVETGWGGGLGGMSPTRYSSIYPNFFPPKKKSRQLA